MHGYSCVKPDDIIFCFMPEFFLERHKTNDFMRLCVDMNLLNELPESNR